LNPLGLDVTFVQPPRPGAIRATLTGDRPETVARLAQTILLGDYPLTQPVVNVIDEFSSIGGGVLKYFVVTFDQERSQVTFYRERREPIVFPPRHSAGLSFSKVGAYWRVVGVVPGSNAASAGVEEGDLITHINNEPVESWSPQRYESLIAQSNEIAFTFLIGRRDFVLKLKVMDLVP
jgi:S1-C subfamily serine protease